MVKPSEIAITLKGGYLGPSSSVCLLVSTNPIGGQKIKSKDYDHSGRLSRQYTIQNLKR